MFDLQLFLICLLIGNRDTKSTLTTTRDETLSEKKKKNRASDNSSRSPGETTPQESFHKVAATCGDACLSETTRRRAVTLPEKSDHRIRYNSWIETIHSGPKSLIEFLSLLLSLMKPKEVRVGWGSSWRQLGGLALRFKLRHSTYPSSVWLVRNVQRWVRFST